MDVFILPTVIVLSCLVTSSWGSGLHDGARITGAMTSAFRELVLLQGGELDAGLPC